ncbi:MAG: lipocalin family protein [Chitinophaga sp.]|uniref:lipocalin family protein n=1 Tax=Chitinophaga sp. TaxID=1869181 RepID=UPI001B032521|nr:lipocalin family protein [Chitinophaga sp.]MBO9731909.1 lipocalin family protein [Chitinophaga sp.]
MKKFSFAALLMAIVAVFATSCSPKQGVTTDINKAAVKGNWVLTDIKYEGIPDNAKVTVFDEANAKCFIGSQWIFPDNWAGASYTISSTENGCNAVTQNIAWTLTKSGGVTQLGFKKLYSGDKAKNVTTGYRVDVVGAGSTMTWRANVNFENKNAAIIYTLQRK